MTQYAQVEYGDVRVMGPMPDSAQDAETGEWITPPDGVWTEELIAQTAYLPVVETPRPPDTETTTYDYSLVVTEDEIVETWTERPKTEGELEAEAITANDEEISNKIETVDMPAMQAIIDQTNANLRADPSQELKDIARAVRRLDRKMQLLLDGTE